jgi:Tol biopolymer transport system component
LECVGPWSEGVRLWSEGVGPWSARSRRARLGIAFFLVFLTACAPEPPAIRITGDASDGLVFVRREGDSFDLYRARLSDGSVVPLRVTPDVEERWPYWSAGAGLLMFQSRRAGRSRGDRLVVLDPDDGRVEPVAEPPARNEHWPMWSPDGRAIAYSFSVATVGESPSGLALVDLATRESEVIAPAGGEVHVIRPEFSPDGEQVLAQRTTSKDDSKLWMLGSGERPRRLTDQNEIEQKGRFSRNGDWIVYTRRARIRSPGDLVMIRPDGSEGHVVSSMPAYDDHTARPSPTRDELAFISNRRGNPEAFLVPFTGGRAKRLTRTPHRHENAPRWSPDGEKIALTVLEAGEVYRVVVVDRDGAVLLDVPGQMPDWMPPWP